METPGEFGVLPEPIAVPPDVDDVAMMDEAVDERRGHHVIAEDLAPFFKAFVAGQDGRRVFVPATHDLEEEHGPGARNREVADLIDHHETREDERAKAGRQPAGVLGLPSMRGANRPGWWRRRAAYTLPPRRDRETSRA